MKKIFIFFAIAFVSNIFAQRYQVYGGLLSSGIVSEDFKDFHISDWQKYGLKILNPSSNEGRVAVKLSKEKPASQILGIGLGANYLFSDRLQTTVELQGGYSKISFGAALVGFKLDLIKSDNFALGVSPKIGYTLAKVDLGEVKLIDNYVAPVILDEGRFTNGDKLEMEIEGALGLISLVPQIKLNENFYFYGSISYQISFSDNSKLKAGDTEIPMKSPAVVKPDFYANPANIEPSVSLTGLNIILGVAINLETP